MFGSKIAHIEIDMGMFGRTALFGLGFIVLGLDGHVFANSRVEMSPEQTRKEFQSEMRWDNDRVYRKCDLTCAYKKANEAIAMYGFYQRQTLVEIMRMPSNSDEERQAQRDAIVQLFPELGLLQSSAGLSDKQLVGLFQQATNGLIDSSADAVEKNNVEMGKLQRQDVKRPGLSPSLPTAGTPAAKDPSINTELQKAQIPTFARSKKLRAVSETQDRSDIEQQGSVSREKLDAWVNLATKAPQKNDIKLFKAVPRDPGDPESDLIQVPVNCGNEQCLDEAQFKRRSEEFEKNVSQNLSSETLQKLKALDPTSAGPAKTTKLQGDSQGKIEKQNRKISRDMQQSNYRKAREELPKSLKSKNGKPLETVGTDPDEIEFKESEGTGSAIRDQYIGVQAEQLRILKPESK